MTSYIKHILLIDDDPDDHEIFTAAAEKAVAGLDCHCIGNAREALQQLMTGTFTPDIIFLDLNMPVMSGQRFLNEIKAQDKLKNIPVIAYSTSSHEPTKAQVIALGASGFITKPADFNDLVGTLRKAFASYSLSPS